MAPPPPKGPPKGAPVATGENLLTELIFLVCALLILAAILARFEGFLNDPLVSAFFGVIGAYFHNVILPILKIAAVVFSVLFTFGIGWMLVKTTALNKEIADFYNAVPAGGTTASGAPASQTNRKWARVLSHLDSTNPNDWKFAILEADIMLSDLLDTLNYPGATMADKLKVANPGDFKTIEAAWEAHKIRNTVAHEGADYVLSDREARRVIDLYRTVFEEFKII